MKHPFIAPRGFQFAGITCGIKDGKKKDLCLIWSETPAAGAGVFTRNRVRSPSVTFSEKALKRPGPFRAVLTNSGNANACTGPQGYKDCQAVARQLAETLSIAPGEVLIASTGIIGVPLPVGKILSGIPRLASELSTRGWQDAMRAIMTTDLVPKASSLRYRQEGKTLTISGMCKGSGMIHPDMATMLGYVVTDAAVERGALREALKAAVNRSFNRITVDGDMSTNDCVFLLANGEAKNAPIRKGTPAYTRFVEHLTEVCRDLAFQIVRDGEGATKFVTVRVEGAKTGKQAYTVANAVAKSSLVKTALFGEDPNWGRILAAAGYSGAPVREDKIEIRLNGASLFKNGGPDKATSQSALRKKMKSRDILIALNLHLGDKADEVYTCDLSYDYVRINGEYTT